MSKSGYNTSYAIGDFINPDYTDPASLGANFWTGVYDTINTPYTAVKDFIRPDFDDPTSFGANFWTGVYDTINAPYTAVNDFIRPDYTDPTSLGANFWTGVSDDLEYAGNFWADKLTQTKDWTLDKWNITKKVASDTLQKAKTTISNTYDTTKDKAKVAANATVNSIKQAGKWLANSTKKTIFRTKEEVGIRDKYDFENARTIREGKTVGKAVNEWTDEFNIRNKYAAKEIDRFLPVSAKLHATRIKLKNGERTYDFDFSTPYLAEDLKRTGSIDVFVHGYNVTDNKAQKFKNDFVVALESFIDYKNPSAAISWVGDIGSNPFTKVALFNRDVQSAEISWPGVANVIDYLHSINPDMKINIVAHSLGARLVLEAAKHGVEFDTVILMLPAVDNEELSVGSRFGDAIKNIDKLRIVHSENQFGVFGLAYRGARFDNALGYVGPSDKIDHPDFKAYNATKFYYNEWGMEINSHGDYLEPPTIKMIMHELGGRTKAYKKDELLQ